MNYDQTKSPLLALLQGGKQRKLPKGQVLPFSDQRMILSLLRSGFIKRYSITSDGTQSIQSIYGPGDIFPLTPAFKAIYDLEIYHGSEVFYYETITEAIIHSIDETTLLEALSHDPIIYKDLLYVSGQRLGSNIQRLENMSLRAANRRVAHQLVHYANKFGQPSERGIMILLPLRHQTLASILNLARETVTHCITRLQEKGLIEANQTITVLDIDKLRREAH